MVFTKIKFDVLRVGSKLISFLFHPLLLATYLALIISVFKPTGLGPNFEDPERASFTVSLIATTTFIIPAISIAILIWIKTLLAKSPSIISDEDGIMTPKSRMSVFMSALAMKNKEERTLPFLFIAVFYVMTTYLFNSKGIFTPNTILIFISVSGLIIVLTFITLFWQISVHSAGVAGLVGILGAVSKIDLSGNLTWPIAGCILLTGIVMSARLHLNSHTPAQVYAGAALGFASTLLPLTSLLI